MLLIREDDVRRLLPMKEAIRLVREAFAALDGPGAQNQPRRRLKLSTGSVLHSMAGACGRYYGAKIYSTHAKHGAHFLFALYDAETAKPLALFEANYLGQIRTGAATGLATDLLAPPGADTVGMIGTGFQARSQLEAVLAVRMTRRVKVWSRSAEKRETFARECGEAFGVRVEAPDSAEVALAGAGIVVTATNAKNPVLEDGWIEAGAHINAVGSNHPRRRELPEALIRRAGLIAVDSIEQARIESGDLLLALQADQWPELPLVELTEVLAGRRGRTSAEEVTIFKSNGLGIEDVAVAGFVYERVLAEGSAVDL
ncbi:MAG: ornithine cyclodeaminase family protein [bacterium]|nr:ornithine cyclodeaminase family protein [bacterium]